MFISAVAFSQGLKLSDGKTKITGLSSIFFTDANTGYAVGYSGIIIKTNDAGNTWTAQNSNTTSGLYSVYFTDTNTGYAVGWSGTILKTSDAGSSWTAQKSGTMDQLSSVYFPDANTGYVTGDRIILKTTDGGTSWEILKIRKSNKYYFNSVYFKDVKTGYIVGSKALHEVHLKGVFLKTTNGGKHWKTKIIKSNLGDGPLSSVYFTDAITGYLVGWYGMNFKTNNAGAGWTDYSDAVIDFNSIYFTDANTGYILGNHGTILKTRNAGIDWAGYYNGKLNSFNLKSVYFTDAKTGYIVGYDDAPPYSYNSIILKTINGGDEWTVLTGEQNSPDNPQNGLSSPNKVATTTLPQYPNLVTSDIAFIDNNGNNRIDANEKCFVFFKITNNGKGAAKNVKAHIVDKANLPGLSLTKDTTVGTIMPGTTINVKIPVNGTSNLISCTANLKVSFDEGMGFPPDPFELSIETKELPKPEVKVVDYSFLTDNGSIKLGAPVQLKALIQNVGQGNAENVSVNFQYPNLNIFPTGESKFSIGDLAAGTSKEIVFEFLPNKLYTEKTIPVIIKISEKYSKFGEEKHVEAVLDSKSSGNTITIASTAKDNKVDIQIASLNSDVDVNIPVSTITKTNTYALIIGNEDYSSYQPNLGTEVNVDFAKNDATIFKNYCIKMLGIPEKQVIFVTNATAALMNQKISQLNLLAKNENGNAELIFYYSGHGLPDEQTKEPYLIPVDVSGSNIQSGVKLQTVYDKLTEFPSKKVTVFIDACFSGGARNQGLLAQRSVKIKPKEIDLKGNLVVFTSSSGDESSGAYKEKQHGYFTYFILKKLQDTKGDVTYNELIDYLKLNVNKESILNSKPQTPDVLYSSDLKDIWKNLKIK